MASGVFFTSPADRWRLAPFSFGSGPCFCWMAPRRFRSRIRCLTRRHHERLTLNRLAIAHVTFASHFWVEVRKWMLRRIRTDAIAHLLMPQRSCDSSQAAVIRTGAEWQVKRGIRQIQRRQAVKERPLG